MVTTRPARPGDIAFLASVMLASSRSHLPRGAWDLMLDAPDDVCLEFLSRMASAEPATFCHWRAFLIAEVDGEPAAALAGFDPGALADPVPAIERTLSTFGWTPEDVARGNERLVPFFTCVPQWIPGLWRVEWVATRPEHRRRGLDDRLLVDMLAAGAHIGHRTAQLFVFVGNTPAIALYEKNGFRIDHDRRDPRFEAAFGSPGMLEMRRPL
jgi:ribosomal protein S18 acetylase RimI-like enzyme